LGVRRELGPSIKEAAKHLGVDEGTFARWESGEGKPRMSGQAIDIVMIVVLRTGEQVLRREQRETFS
jgi:DNA-binding transcriptional regulator YiaG